MAEPGLRRKRRALPPSGIVAFLDVIFATVGVFIAVIVIQSTLVRSAAPPAEADVYAVLMDDGRVADRVAPVAPWVGLGLSGARVTALPTQWIARLERLAEAGAGPVKVELAHGPEALRWRRALQIDLADTASAGTGPAGAPAFMVVWRPLPPETDPAKWLARRARDTESSDAR